MEGKKMLPLKYTLAILILVLFAIISGCVSDSDSNSSSMNPTIPATLTPTGTPSPTPRTQQEPIPVTTTFTQSPQITLTSNPANPTTQTTQRITSDDINTHFMDLAFGGGNSMIHKNIPWDISTGTAGKGDKELLEKFILEFNDVSQSGKISENLRDGTTGDLKIKFIPQEGMEDVASYDKIFKSNDIITAKISPEIIYINNNLKGDQRNHTLLRSLYYQLGVTGDTLTYSDSLFFYDENSNTKLTLIDKKALEVFFGTGVKNGMNVDDVKKVVYIK